jgi:uncharacterized iron-regulated membrane protein
VSGLIVFIVALTRSIYGYPTKFLAFLICLFALTLPITGLLIWLERKKKEVFK